MNVAIAVVFATIKLYMHYTNSIYELKVAKTVLLGLQLIDEESVADSGQVHF